MELWRASERSADGGLAFDRIVAEGVQMCPFLRNIGESTSFSFMSPPTRFPTAAPAKGNQGPIFEDGPNFELAFKLFHGCNGVVPLSGRNYRAGKLAEPNAIDSEATSVKFHPLAASAAAISLSSFGASGPFGFDAFMSKRKKMKRNNTPKKKEQQPEKKNSSTGHEAWSNEWLQTGNCPIAKSFQAVSGVLPLVAKMFQPPPGMKILCPPAIVAARAALARTAAVKAIRPQPLPSRVLAVGMLGMAMNVPLGIWREHTEKFSPAWFTAVHAAVPFIAMLRKAVHMPKYAMAFTIAASILGQVIGSRAERKRIELAHLRADEAAHVASGGPLFFATTGKEGIRAEVSHDKLDAYSQQCAKDLWNSTNTSPSADPLSVC